MIGNNKRKEKWWNKKRLFEKQWYQENVSVTFIAIFL